jgi:hypothetical protein
VAALVWRPAMPLAGGGGVRLHRFRGRQRLSDCHGIHPERGPAPSDRTATGAMNFFRALASTLVVAVPPAPAE